jgi:hypothetical protein
MQGAASGPVVLTIRVIGADSGTPPPRIILLRTSHPKVRIIRITFIVRITSIARIVRRRPAEFAPGLSPGHSHRRVNAALAFRRPA